MNGVFFDVIEINIVVSAISLVMFLLSGKLRKRYGAGWMKMVWILLAVRLLIPYNFSVLNPVLYLMPSVEDPASDSLNIRQEENNAEAFVDFNENFSDGKNLTGNISGVNDAESYGGKTTGVAAADGVPKSDMDETGIIGNGIISPVTPNTDQENEKGTDRNEQRGNVVWRRIISGLEILPLIWIEGVGFSLAYCLVGYICFLFNCQKNLFPITDINLRKQIMRLERKLDGRANIPVYQNRRAQSPMLTGFFMPKLILPAEKGKWSETELELVVAHELCHYRNKDLWLKLLMIMAWCVNWFNPLVWILKKQFFYEMELACDDSVLADYDVEMREIYARIMLSFARKKGHATAFSTGFGESKRQMKRRIDYMLDSRTRKKGVIGIVMTCILVLSMGLLISCGNKPEAEGTLGAQDTTQGETADLSGQGEGTDSTSQAEIIETELESSGTQMIPYNPNNEYNEMIRCYGENIYIAREDGIYCLSDDGVGEELLYANDYRIRRGMEVYEDFLYFCGSAKRGEQDTATIYRMDLNSYEVKDALAHFSQVFDSLYNITIYDGKLYVANGYSISSGFELDENGEIGKVLDAEAEDFLFREDNEYWSLQLKIWNNEAVFDSEEYWDTVNQMSDMYRNAIDTAACEKMLNGDQVVLKYKDESLTSVYLKKKNGEYEFLCDRTVYPILVTETGVYYFPDESGDIWYVDYETKTREKIWERDGRKALQIQLINYDQDYIYFTTENHLGRNQENEILYESYIMRVPRWKEGKAEKVYRFEEMDRLGSLQRNCGIAGGRMFFNEHETISLDPDVNGMEKENSGELSEDAAAMRQGVEAFAEAYFQNDEETLKAYLSENFEGRIDFYPYPEQAEQIEGLYISGLPDGELPAGVICYVSYEFSGNVETDAALSYLSMEMEKTEQGWRILSYGLEG